VSTATTNASVVDFLEVVDQMDATALSRAFTEDGSFRFGNNEAAVGRREIERSVSAFFSMIGGLTHEITGIWSGSWEAGDVRSVESWVTYLRLDGSEIRIPATTTFRLQGDLIRDCRVYVDIAPLFAGPE
jgi:hypothetical protein